MSHPRRSRLASWRLARALPAIVLFAAVVVACSSRSSATANALETAREIAFRGRDVAIERALAPNAERGFHPRGDGFVSAGFRAATSGDFERLGAETPRSARGTAVVGLSRFARHRLRLTLEGANDVTAKLTEGRLLYENALRDTDLIAVADPDRFEHLFVVREPAGEWSVRYNIAIGAGLRGWRTDPSGAVALVDARGDAVLRVPAPFAIDARGQRRDATLEMTRDELVVRLDTTGLAAPLLVDPAVELPHWEQRITTKAPSGRASPGLAYDAARKRTLLFGGYRSDNAAPENYLGDTWAWDGTDWEQLSPAQSPPRRESPPLAYDVRRGRVMLFGGAGCADPPVCSVFRHLDDLWEWNGATWIERVPTPPGAAWPSARARHVFVYDVARGKTLLFGGEECTSPDCAASQFLSDTWEWDGDAWTKLSPANAPSKRSTTAFVHDASRGVSVLFGGTGCKDPPACAASGILADTWEWNGATWTNITGPTPPPARTFAPMAYDSATKTSLLPWGFSGLGFFAESWQLSGKTWDSLTDVAGPSPRLTHALAYHAERRRTLLFGGTQQDRTYPVTTWEYHTSRGTCSTDTDCDTAHCIDGVCCEEASCGACEACNTPGSLGRCTSVASQDDPDACSPQLNGKTCDAAGNCKKATGAACVDGTECATGHCADGSCCDSACSSACDVCAKSLGASANGTCTTAPTGYAGSPSCNGYVCDGALATCPASCTGDEECTPGSYCDKNSRCQPRKTVGGACNAAAGADCLKGGCRVCAGTGACADGVCCSQACNGPCDVCSVALGATANGTCTTAPKGYAGSPTCYPFVCGGSTTCTSSCVSDQDCGSQAYCDNGGCRGSLANGSACGSNAACASNHCVDGICCDTGCSGQCEACDVPSAPGVCTPVVGIPHGTREACASPSSGEPCAAAECNGDVRDRCAGFVGSSVTCRTASCSSGVGTLAGACNSKGACPTAITQDCTPYACGTNACRTSCTVDADCGPGATCDVVTARCLSGSTCEEDRYVVAGGGGARTDCAPFRCAGGACRTDCRGVADCVFPAACDAHGRCVAPDSDDASSSDGCAMGAGRSNRVTRMLPFLALLFLRRARRSKPRLG